MFTNPNTIKTILSDLGFTPNYLRYLNKGAMTDKYSFSQDGCLYIARCFPQYNSKLAETEFRYLNLFRQKSIKAPKACAYKDGENPLLIYEMLPGYSLSECFHSLSYKQKKILADEIATNYKAFAEIIESGYGTMESFGKFSSTSWKSFLFQEIKKNLPFIKSFEGTKFNTIYDYMIREASALSSIDSALVWSDFSADNIIVDDEGKLSGFIDFEGLMSGDPRLGLGYLIAHEGYSELSKLIFNSLNIERSDRFITFYAIFRFIRLLPYLSYPLPNGRQREDIRDYLKYSHEIISNFIYKF